MTEIARETRPALEWRNVTKTYDGGGHPAEEGSSRAKTVLADASLCISPGEWAFLTGPSGAGKTTLLRLAYGATRPTAGSVHIFGQDIASRPIHRIRRSLGLVFQSFELLSGKTALENVAYGAEILGVPPREARARAAAMLEAVGLAAAASRMPSALSGGEQQRVGMARALIHRPPIILADEPTGNLDQAAARIVFDVLARIHDDWAPAMLVATHSRDLLEWSGGRVVHVEDGRLTP